MKSNRSKIIELNKLFRNYPNNIYIYRSDYKKGTYTKSYDSNSYRLPNKPLVKCNDYNNVGYDYEIKIIGNKEFSDRKSLYVNMKSIIIEYLNDMILIISDSACNGIKYVLEIRDKNILRRKKLEKLEDL